MKLIVGLGNPGREYENTRHNIGFICVDNYANNNNLDSFKEKFNGAYTKFMHNGEQVILLKPLSYMNLSGTVVRKYVDYFKIQPSDILVIHDDLDMPTGKIKLKANSSSGGHNGIKNIIQELNTQNFNHLKIGISKDNRMDVKDYVLGKFTQEEKNLINDLVKTTDKIINDYLTMNFDKLMGKYNGVGNNNKKDSQNNSIASTDIKNNNLKNGDSNECNNWFVYNLLK